MLSRAERLPRGTRTRTLTLWCTPEQIDALDNLARTELCTRAHMGRTLINEALRARGAPEMEAAPAEGSDLL